MADDVFYVMKSPEVYKGSRRTFIVMGAPRGGTSLVAGSLRLAGVYMGDGLGNQHEDPEFRREVSLEDKLKSVKKRNEEHEVWGWKLPDSIYYVRDLMDKLINPCFIVVYRNPFSIAKSSSERDEAPFDISLLGHPNFHYRKIFEILRDYEVPTALVSYESAVNDPSVFSEKILEFCNVDDDGSREKEISNFVNPKKGYQDL